MDISIPGWRNHKIVSLGAKMKVGVQLSVAALSFTGIVLLLWFHLSQNGVVAEAYQELTIQEQMDGPLTPVELSDLAHRACVLDTRINNVQSFFQPLSSTLSNGGWCGNYVRVFINFADQAGYPAHKFHIQSNGRSHTLAEVFYDGKWRIIDPFFNQVYLLPNGEMATYTDLRQNIALVNTPTRGEVADPLLDRIFSSYQPIFQSLYQDAPEFHVALNLSALYHNIFVVLSYPLDPFYEGERRPILPAWLDRVELLGIYFLAMVLVAALAPFGVSQFNRVRHRR